MVNQVTDLLASKLLRADCKCSKSNIIQHAVAPHNTVATFSCFLVDFASFFVSDPVNFDKFNLSLVYLKCVQNASPVHLLVGLGPRICNLVNFVFEILHLPSDDHFTMMYVRILVRMIVF